MFNDVGKLFSHIYLTLTKFQYMELNTVFTVFIVQRQLRVKTKTFNALSPFTLRGCNFRYN